MIISMTGYGRGTSEVEGLRVLVEISSVNSRYCEVYTRLPRALNVYDPAIQTAVKKGLDRGKINVNIQTEDTAGSTAVPPLNEMAVLGYAERLRQAAALIGSDEPIQLEHILRFSDLFGSKEGSEESANRTWLAIEQALHAAIADMNQMREQEGLALKSDFTLRMDNIETQLGVVVARAPERLPEYRQRMLERLEQILSDERIDKDRLEFELAIMADKLDITEEIVRLRSHLVLFREALNAREPSGRKLNFLVQEINREINTIGSKANDALITQQVISMKEELEKVREQVQNIV